METTVNSRNTIDNVKDATHKNPFRNDHVESYRLEQDGNTIVAVGLDNCGRERARIVLGNVD